MRPRLPIFPILLLVLSGAALARGAYLVHVRTDLLVECVHAEEALRRDAGLPWNTEIRREVAVDCQIARVEREQGAR